MKTLIFSFVFAILVIVGINYLASGSFNIFVMPGNGTKVQNATRATNVQIAQTANSPDVLPKAVDLDVPFIVQAPNGDWSYPFDHNCEEASILMLHYYLTGKSKVVADETKQEMLDMVAFEIKQYGFHEDANAAQVAKFIEDYYGYSVKVTYDISAEDIKKEVSRGNPVMVIAAGRVLENPNFKAPGPLTHALIIKGYDKLGFITNDPGTRNGADFRYSFENLYEAIHDLDDKDILLGKKLMIVVTK